MGLFDGLDWGDIINAALGWYGIQQSQKAPKFYNVPPTPAESWRLDATKGLYGMGASSLQNFLGGLTSENLTPNFQMNNNLVGNPAFMGGIKVPGLAPSHPITVPPTGAGGSTPPPKSTPPPDYTDPTPFGSSTAGDPFTGSLPPNIRNDPAQSSMFNEFVGKYGKAAGEGLLALLTQNPAVGLKALIDAWNAHSAQSLPPEQHKPYPIDVLKPSTPDGELPQNYHRYPIDILKPGTPQAPPSPWDKYRGDQKWSRDLWGDNGTAGQIISQFLNSQNGGGGGFGRHRAF